MWSPAAELTTQHHNYGGIYVLRVTLEGFKVKNQTWDHALQVELLNNAGRIKAPLQEGRYPCKSATLPGVLELTPRAFALHHSSLDPSLAADVGNVKRETI